MMSKEEIKELINNELAVRKALRSIGGSLTYIRSGEKIHTLCMVLGDRTFDEFTNTIAQKA